MFPLGALNLIKTSKAGVCRNGSIALLGTGVSRGLIAVPDHKLWVIQEVAVHNLSTTPRSGTFLILDESQDLVGYLSVETNPVFSLPAAIGGIPSKASFVGTGAQYIPYGWFLGVEVDLKSIPNACTFYWHISEVDLD